MRIWRVVAPVAAFAAALAFTGVSLTAGAPAREAASVLAAPFVSGLVAVAAAVRASRRGAPGRLSWALFAASYLIIVVGDLTWLGAWVSASPRPMGSALESLYASAFPFLLAGLVALPAGRVAPGERVRFFLDLATIGTGASLLVGYLLLEPALADRTVDLGAALVAVAPSLGDLVVIGAVAMLLLRGPSPQLRTTLVLVASAIGVTVGADLSYAGAIRTGAYESGGLVDASWLFGNALFVVAAVTAADAADEGGKAADVWWERVANALPLLGMVAGFATLFALAAEGGEPRPWFAGGAGLLCLLVGVRQLHLVVQNAALHAELAVQYDKSERVLANVLPAAVAARLKERPNDPIADKVDDATVLFADIVGFTPLSATMGPEALLRLLDDVFSRFDRVAERHGLEKIKTIGDAYMAAAGVPDPRPGHAADAAWAGLAMIAAIDEINRERGLSLQLRVGLHSGPVVAGVIGTQKRVYDLWGDAVNTASRMESHGVAHAVQLTAATRDRLGEGFVLEPRGDQDIKGKGVMETWLLRGAQRELFQRNVSLDEP